MSTETEPQLRYKIGDWVYTYIARFNRPFYAEIVKIDFEKQSFLVWQWQTPVYWLRIPKQEWTIGKLEQEIAKTQSELNSRY